MKVLNSILFLMTYFMLFPSKGIALHEENYEFKDTRDLVNFVHDAAKLVKNNGEKSFEAFRKKGSTWRKKDQYIFVLDPDGNMLVHADPLLEGKNNLNLKDIQGRPIIRGLIQAAITHPSQTKGWYHYLWNVPDEILPRWKSSFVERVQTADGKVFIVGSGMYNDRMEKNFVIDMVDKAAKSIEQKGSKAFIDFYDKSGDYIIKSSYIFVIDSNGNDLVNPVFKNLEGRNLLDLKDTHDKYPIREMMSVAKTKGSGWVNYMWPMPGDNVSTEKSAYVKKVQIGKDWVLVGSGVYFSESPKSPKVLTTMTSEQLKNLVKDAALLLEKKGINAFPEFKKKGSRWFQGDSYFFVWNMDGTRALHAAEPNLEGKNGSNEKDILGRPYGKMFLDVAKSSKGEGWVHYVYPEPGQIFPIWKSVYLKRVTFPDGQTRLIGSGSYNMKIAEDMIVDLVDQAGSLIEMRGRNAFDMIRDQKGRFSFMDTYVFVDDVNGLELVNSTHPSLEGKNILNLKDTKGKSIVKDYINAAQEKGSAWVDYFWYKPMSNIPVLKKTFVKKVKFGNETFIVGSGIYVEEGPPMAQEEK